MELKLSKRLRTVVDLVDPCDTIVDIGTDHGFVPITIANENKAKKVIATDVNPAPLESCIANKEKYLLDKNFDFKCIVCDGLTGIDKKMPIGIIITGMGYDSIVDILKNIDEYNYKFLILSPQSKVNEFVKYIVEKNIMTERIETVYEDDKMYLIFKCYSKKMWDRLYGDVNED